MKSTYGILWYFFIIYATSVIVNFSHYHKTLDDSTNESMIFTAAKCLIQGSNEAQDNCKLTFQYKKETVLFFLKNLLSRKEFNKAYKLTLKNGSKKNTLDLVNITLDLKPLFDRKNATNSDKLSSWYSFYIFISILLITFITPLWPLTNYIYIITLASMIIFSITIYLQIVKLIVFSLVYLITLKKYKFWLLPNLNKDVGILSTFWPLYELTSNYGPDNCTNNIMLNENDKRDQSMNKENKIDCNNSKKNNKLKPLNFEKIEPYQTGVNEIDETSSNETIFSVKNKSNQMKMNPTETKSINEIKSTIETKLIEVPKSITEFVGNDLLNIPTITKTPPPSLKFTFKNGNLNNACTIGRPQLEIIDLKNEQEENLDDMKLDEESEYVNSYANDFASITPTISYLNVNEVRRRQNSPVRKRIASNRSDDGFEILINDFLKDGSPPKDELFCSKPNL